MLNIFTREQAFVLVRNALSFGIAKSELKNHNKTNRKHQFFRMDHKHLKYIP